MKKSGKEEAKESFTCPVARFHLKSEAEAVSHPHKLASKLHANVLSAKRKERKSRNLVYVSINFLKLPDSYNGSKRQTHGCKTFKILKKKIREIEYQFCGETLANL